MPIREAIPQDCAALTEIVRSSQAYTGEYRRLVEAAEITPQMVAEKLVFVWEEGGETAGFYILLVKGPESIELDYLFVANAFIGQGIGRQMFADMLGRAAGLGFAEVEIISHPPSEAFYLRMGAVRRGMVPPRGRVTWERPQLFVRC